MEELVIRPQIFQLKLS